MEKKRTDQLKNRRFRSHISIIIEQTGGLLIALLIVFIPSLLENIDEIMEEGIEFLDGRGLLVNLGVVLVFIIIIVLQLVVWSKTYISIQENAIVIERDALNKKKNTISIHSISNINMEQNLFEMLIGTCKVKMDTNSRSTADSTDVKIVLKKADALWFKQEIMRRIQDTESGFERDDVRLEECSGNVLDKRQALDQSQRQAGQVSTGMSAFQSEDYDVRADMADILQHGFFSVNILSVMVIILGIAGAVGPVLEVLGKPDMAGTILGAASGILVTVIVVLSALWDTVKDFVRYYDFRAKRRGNKIYICYGFFKKVEYTIPVDKIQALKLHQSLIARLGNRYMAEIINVGMGDDQEEKNSFLVLYASEKKLKEQLAILLPEFLEAAGAEVEMQPAAAWAAWIFPAAVYTLAVAGTAALCMFGMEEYRQWVLPGAAGLEVCLLIGMFLKYRTDGVLAEREFLKLSRGYFARTYLMVRYQNIQYVHFSQNPLAGLCGIQKGQIHLLASSVNTSHSVPYFKGNTQEIMKEGMLR